MVIAGPTASGKTSLAVEVAKRIGGEIISADSMQIYKELDIGTAKASAAEQSIVPHHLIDIIEPNVAYSAADFVKDAAAAVEEIASRGRIPIVCGGTGFYIDSLINGAEFDDKGRDEAVRSKLAERAETGGLEAMYSELSFKDPTYAAAIHKNDAKRIIRALEIIETTGSTPTEQKARLKSGELRYNLLYFVLDAEDRKTLYSRIEQRIDRMVQSGVLDEARYVYCNRNSFSTAVQAIGYKEFFPYIEGCSSLAECVCELKTATRRYAKRQISWFKRSGHAQVLLIDKMSEREMIDYVVAKAKASFALDN